MSGTLTNSIAIVGEGRATALAAALVRRCVDFHVEPYPEDNWVFSYKLEALSVVREENAIAGATTAR